MAFSGEILNFLGSLKMVLWEISQNSQENICAGIPYFDKVKLNRSICSFVKNETLEQLFSCEFCKIRQDTFFTEHHQTTASDHSSINC